MGRAHGERTKMIHGEAQIGFISASFPESTVNTSPSRKMSFFQSGGNINCCVTAWNGFYPYATRRPQTASSTRDLIASRSVTGFCHRNSFG